MATAAKITKKSILIVEDDLVIAKLLANRLKRSGYAVQVVGNGSEGVAAIEKKKPDLVLLDIVMPKMDGYMVLQELREKGFLPALPVIVISNSGEPVAIERIRNMGVRDYLIKVNISPGEVVAAKIRKFQAEMKIVNRF
ncbi:MAG: hypothetical protein Greene07144_553 [Parcubacteria group bacterium Greene0714_4]|nr:MAG: hypothetical protein Greene07144_553 [Parcubacteria group bacterium Greene0714_4]